MIESQQILKTSLLDLLYELRDQQMPLILAGGYGLYLKQVFLQETSSSPTLIRGELWPAPRATEDLDFLLKTEVVVDAARMRRIRAALDKLGYVVIEKVEFLQFKKPLALGMSVKVDLLTGPLELYVNDPRVKADKVRIRLRDSVELHAHPTDGAVGFQEDTLAIPIGGVLSSGQQYEAVVHVPQAFSLLLMKLHAFRDRRMDEKRDMARHHALDLYRIVAMMTEDEFKRTQQRVKEYQGEKAVTEANRLVREHFASDESLGSLRLREHSLWNEGMALAEFLSALKDLFRVPA